MLHSHRKDRIPVCPSPLLRRLKNPFIAGTLVLTVTGLVSRLVGFFYRIFLSRLFGEENIGIYQLISPVMSLVFSFSAAGLQNAISKFAAGKETSHDGRAGVRVLFVGLLFSLPSSLFCTAVIFSGSDFIAERLLFEPRCAPLLRIAALSFPFSAVHSCINGYFYGLRKASVPASAQLMEQFVRVGSVYLISLAALQSGRELSVSVAAAGMVIGEMASMLLTICAVASIFPGSPLYGAKGFLRPSRCPPGKSSFPPWPGRCSPFPLPCA